MVGVRIKHALFQNSGWLSAVAVTATVVSTWQFASQNWQIVVTATGGALSLAYFIQKQKLEELRLFKELFVEFNARYVTMVSTIDFSLSRRLMANYRAKKGLLYTSTSISVPRSSSSTGLATSIRPPGSRGRME